MRHNFYLFTFIAISLAVITGCKSQPKSASTDVEADSADSIVAKTLSISIEDAKPIAENLDIVKKIVFDEDVEEVMGIPQAIEFRGDTIFAVDSYQAPGVYAYLTDGTQLWAYCSEGGGEEDASSPFNLNVTDDGVSVYDMSVKKIVVLDKAGKFVKTIHAHPDTQNIIMDRKGGIWTDYSNQSDGTALLSYRASADDEEMELLPVPELLKGMTVVGLRSLSPLEDGSINYMSAVEPRVYSLRDGKATLKYEFDFGSLWPDDETIRDKFTGNSWARKFRDFPV